MKSQKLKLAILILIGILLTAAPVEAQAVANDSGFNPKALLCNNALPWIESLGIVSAIAFMVIYIIATVAFLPGSILTLAGGAIFGLFWGSIYVFFGATIGATLAFLVGRYCTN